MTETTVKWAFVLAEPKATISCGGMNHSEFGALGTCSGCGARLARVAKGAGNKIYPVIRSVSESGFERFRFTCWTGGHTCEPERAALHQRAVLLDLGRGVLFVGAPAIVVKGRKVPVGTAGTVTWMGEGAYGPRLGLRDGEGTVHWTAASNVEVHLTGELAAQVARRMAEAGEA